MADAVQVLWATAGTTLTPLGTRALVDFTDGDTPNIRMPVRLLSVDTPEITAEDEERAQEVDAELLQLAEWIEADRAPITPPLAEVLLPKLRTGSAGSLQFRQGSEASAFAEANAERRLAREGQPPRSLFVRTGDEPFDDNGRLLAYVAPNFTPTERRTLTRAQRSTFNLDLVTAGWAATLIIYPSVPGEEDLPLLVDAAATARAERRGIWADDATLLAYEYRSMERLFRITRMIVAGEEPRGGPRAWRERYCVDLRDRTLHGPEDWFRVDPEYRLFVRPADVGDAVARLNLVPSPSLGRA